MGAPPIVQRADQAGRTIGRFEVTSQAGSGAMGVVYRAHDAQLDRVVALKVLHAEGPRARARARREALAMARLRHPAVVPIHEVGDDDGRVFIAMEYVDGQSLEAWAKEQARAWRPVTEILRRVGAGLAAAHREGLVHRDLKPSNVLVDRDGHPRIIDFGLARAPGEVATEVHEAAAPVEAPFSADLTRTGRLMGTPAYMAPELLAGAPATPASDQFAFCVTFFEVLLGHPPFPRDNLAMLRRAALLGEIQVPANSGVPAPLVAVLRRGLAPHPEGRWRSMDELLAALTELLDMGRPRRRGVPRAVAAVLLVCIVAVAIVEAIMEPLHTAWSITAAKAILVAVLALGVAVFRRRIALSPHAWAIARAALGILTVQLALMLISARLGAPPDLLWAGDVLVLTVGVELARRSIPEIPPVLRWYLPAALALIVAAPGLTTTVHHVSGLVTVAALFLQYRRVAEPGAA